MEQSNQKITLSFAPTKIVAALLGAGFALGTALPIKAGAAPYGAAPIAVPAVIEAEHFDKGGQNVGYFDKVAGNLGAQFRPAEDVDIVATSDGYAVNNFETGEWLAYTINVPAAGSYKIELLLATAFTNSSFHVQIDGKDVTGPIAVPTTGGWNTFQWVGKSGIALTAGTHVLKVFANQQYFNLDKINVALASSSPVASTPYSGTPAAVPGTLQAENFDRGGQGNAYNDSTTGNIDGQYRTGEDVDIARANGGYVVNRFMTGEWLKYTVNVAETAQYDIALSAANPGNSASFQVLVDDVDVTGSVGVPNTGGWGKYQWITKQGVTLPAGKHVLKVVSSQQNFRLDALRFTKTVATPTPTPAPTPTPPPSGGARQFFCTFTNSPGECGFGIQAKSNARVTVVQGGRDGGTAVRLRTEPGDNNVFGSGDSERADLSLSQSATDCSQGKEAWWAHSVMFPTDYVPALNGFGVVMDFHHDYPTGQANFHLDSSRWDGQLHFRGYGGSNIDGGEYETTIGPIVKNQWYDFVYHVRWSSGSDGFMQAWVNGVKKLDHRGPTLYSGISCYLKIANYHSPFGQGSSVIHDRVIRGTTWDAVSLTPLEGVQ